MPGEKDVIIETEDSNSTFVGKFYFKSTQYNYSLVHMVKIYDMGIFKLLITTLGLGNTFPPLATDFGAHTEMFVIDFLINEGNDTDNEQMLMDLNYFVRFQSAFATSCYLNIGNNIKEDGTRMLGVDTKGIRGKIADITFSYSAESAVLTCRLTFIQCYDLFDY